jgi:hypothetical protein
MGNLLGPLAKLFRLRPDLCTAEARCGDSGQSPTTVREQPEYQREEVNMTLHDIFDREKRKFKTYPITGALSIVLLALTIYHTVTGA